MLSSKFIIPKDRILCKAVIGKTPGRKTGIRNSMNKEEEEQGRLEKGLVSYNFQRLKALVPLKLRGIHKKKTSKNTGPSSLNRPTKNILSKIDRLCYANIFSTTMPTVLFCGKLYQ